MPTYIAFLDSDNLVSYVVQSPDDGQNWVQIYAERNNCRCVEVSEDGSFRNKRAATGDKYYEDVDAFIEPCPYAGWTLNKSEKRWDPPVAMPDDGLGYIWDESENNWRLVDSSVIE